MRFGFLVAMVFGVGALAGASVQFVLDPSSASLAAGQSQGNASAKFDIADLNPIRLIYDAVMKQVTTGANRPSFAVGTPVPIADFSKIDAQIKLNDENFRRMGNSGGIGQLPQNGPR